MARPRERRVSGTCCHAPPCDFAEAVTPLIDGLLQVVTDPTFEVRLATAVLALLAASARRDPAEAGRALRRHPGPPTNPSGGAIGTEVSIGRSSFPATYRVVPIEEAMAVLAAYERGNRLAAPVVRVLLSYLLGWC